MPSPRLELKVPPPVVAALVGVAMWFAGAAASALDFEFPGRVALACVLAAAAVGVGVAAVVQFGKARTTISPLSPQSSSALVSEGIYRFTRNPMYLAMLTVLVAWALVVSNLAAFLLPPLFVLYINRFQILPEERALRAKFGAGFDAYCSRVRRWL